MRFGVCSPPKHPGLAPNDWHCAADSSGRWMPWLSSSGYHGQFAALFVASQPSPTPPTAVPNAGLAGQPRLW